MYDISAYPFWVFKSSSTLLLSLNKLPIIVAGFNPLPNVGCVCKSATLANCFGLSLFAIFITVWSFWTPAALSSSTVLLTIWLIISLEISNGNKAGIASFCAGIRVLSDIGLFISCCTALTAFLFLTISKKSDTDWDDERTSVGSYFVP